MKNQIQILIGLLSLSNLKMKVVLTVLVLLICEQAGLWRSTTFFEDSSMIKMGGLLSLHFPNQMNKLLFYFERFKNNSGLSVYVKNYSTNSSARPLSPVKLYKNADIEKLQIIKENKGKAGVYRWVNSENGRSYVGSSVNLEIRFRNYYTISYLEGTIYMVISKALLKYGYFNFCLEILEYCAAEKCLEREQYYLDLLQPEYNILKVAGSPLGYKHTPEAIAKMKNRILTEEQKAKHLEQLNRLNSSPEQKERLKRLHANTEFQHKRLEHLKVLHADPEYQAKRLELLKRLHESMKGRARPKGAGVPSVAIEVFDILNSSTTVYPSISEAARAIEVTSASIRMAFKRKNPDVSTILIKKRYQITKNGDG